MRRPTPRVLFLSTINPAGRDVGKKIVVAGLCRFLHDRLGPEDFLLATTDDVERDDAWNARQLRAPSTTEKSLHVLIDSLALGRSSIQESLFRSARLRRDIARVIEEFQPDIVIFDTVRLGQYLVLAGERRRKILHLDDLFSVRYERMLRAAQQDGVTIASPLGNFARHVPGLLRGPITANGTMVRHLLQLERRLVQRSEMRQAREADTTLLINRDEVRTLEARVPGSDVRECPPLLGDSARVERRWSGEPSFVFLGALNLPHNLSAIERFLTVAFPELVKRMPQATLCLIGRGAPESLARLAATFGRQVILAGFVPDARSVLARSCALIAPLIYGSGTKIKVIEALAAGAPLIATPIGAEGVNLVDGRHGFLVDDLRDFPEAMTRLADVPRNQRCSLACRDLYDQEYSTEVVYRRYSRILGLEDPGA